MLVVVKIYSQRPTGPVDTVRRRRPIDNVDPPSQLTLAPAVPAATQADPSHSPISRTAKALVQESTTRDSPTAWDPKVSTGRPEYVTFSAVIVYCDRRLGSTAVVSVALALVGQKIVAGRRRKSSFSSRHTISIPPYHRTLCQFRLPRSRVDPVWSTTPWLRPTARR